MPHEAPGGVQGRLADGQRHDEAGRARALALDERWTREPGVRGWGWG